MNTRNLYGMLERRTMFGEIAVPEGLQAEVVRLLLRNVDDGLHKALVNTSH